MGVVFRCGGKVDTKDIALLIKYVTGGNARAPKKGTPEFEACDVDDSADQGGILNKYDTDALRELLKERGLL